MLVTLAKKKKYHCPALDFFYFFFSHDPFEFFSKTITRWCLRGICFYVIFECKIFRLRWQGSQNGSWWWYIIIQKEITKIWWLRLWWWKIFSWGFRSGGGCGGDIKKLLLLLLLSFPLLKKLSFSESLSSLDLIKSSLWCQVLHPKIYSNIFFSNAIFPYQRANYRVLCVKMFYVLE